MYYDYVCKVMLVCDERIYVGRHTSGSSMDPCPCSIPFAAFAAISSRDALRSCGNLWCRISESNGDMYMRLKDLLLLVFRSFRSIISHCPIQN